MSDSNSQAHFEYFAAQLSLRGLAYLHVLEGDMIAKSSTLDYRALRSTFAGPYIGRRALRRHRSLRAWPFRRRAGTVPRYREFLEARVRGVSRNPAFQNR